MNKEELIKKAISFPNPEEKNIYNTEVAVQKNILLLGKSGGGVLKNASFVTSREGTLFAGSRLGCQYTPLLVRNNSGKAFSLNVIDGPGLFEVRSASKEKRTNEQILKLVDESVRHYFTTLSAIFICIPLTGVLNAEDLETLDAISAFLGDGFKKNTILLFTKADTFQLDSLQGKVAEFLESGNAVPFVNFCQGGIYFTGAVAGELASEYGEMYETKTKHKVSCLRQHIIDAIVGCPDVPLPAAFWTKSEPAPAPAHTEKAPEKTSKPEPAAKPEKPEPGSLNSTPSRNSLTPNKKEATKREKSTDKGSDKK